jgi:hypothetical protein
MSNVQVQMVNVLPTPTAGLTLTSIVASSGISSRRNTSIGPLTAPMMEKPLCVYVAEPSARFRCVSVTSGATIVDIFAVVELAGLFAQCRIASPRRSPKFRWGDASSDQSAAEAPMPRCIILDPGACVFTSLRDLSVYQTISYRSHITTSLRAIRSADRSLPSVVTQNGRLIPQCITH